MINNIGKYRTNGTWYHRPLKKIKFATLHHDCIPHGQQMAPELLRIISKNHIGREWPGPSYHYWIHRDGMVYQLNDLSDITWHDTVNKNSIGVCMTGFFHPGYNNTPTNQQRKALFELFDHLKGGFSGLQLRAHRDVDNTACPGDRLYPLLEEYRKGVLPTDNMTKDETLKYLKKIFNFDDEYGEGTPTDVQRIAGALLTLGDDVIEHRTRIIEAEADIETLKTQPNEPEHTHIKFGEESPSGETVKDLGRMIILAAPGVLASVGFKLNPEEAATVIGGITAVLHYVDRYIHHRTGGGLLPF